MAYRVNVREPVWTKKAVAVAKHDGLVIPKGLQINSLSHGPAHQKLIREIQTKHRLHVTGNFNRQTLDFLFPKPQPVPKRERAIHAAMTQLGVHEKPAGSNGGPEVDVFTKAANGYVSHEAWCGDFTYWCSLKAGIKLPRFYYPRASAWAENLPHVAHVAVRLGDIVIFRWSNGEFHVARFLKWVQLPSGAGIQTIDGNASDQVGINTRLASNVYAIVRTAE